MAHFADLVSTYTDKRGKIDRAAMTPPSKARTALIEAYRLIAVLCGGSVHVLSHACDTLRIPRPPVVPVVDTQERPEPSEADFLASLGGVVNGATTRFEAKHDARPWLALTITARDTGNVAVLHGLQNREQVQIEIPAPRNRAELRDLVEVLRLTKKPTP